MKRKSMKRKSTKRESTKRKSTKRKSTKRSPTKYCCGEIEVVRLPKWVHGGRLFFVSARTNKRHHHPAGRAERLHSVVSPVEFIPPVGVLPGLSSGVVETIHSQWVGWGDWHCELPQCQRPYVGGGLQPGAALVVVHLAVVTLQPRFTAPTVAGCFLVGCSVVRGLPLCSCAVTGVS
jgi:hypothetical protein